MATIMHKIVPSSAYFSNDYSEAKRRFSIRARELGGRFEQLPLKAKDPGGENLTIDIACFGSGNPRRVLLHSSGLHGVEGFAGSAIQLQLLDELPSLPDGTAVVVVHVLNPYGMAWLRRVNSENVDLNRNFVADGDYTGAPATYSHCDPLLNPETPPSRDFFLLRAQGLIFRYGMSALKQAVAGGQYEYPKGLFFGGKNLQQELSLYRSFLHRNFESANRVFAVDVHTGLGKYAEDTLLVEADGLNAMKERLGDRVRPLNPDRGPAYRVRGGL
jgi:hypothetical protein